jgi:hypothetical protein
VSLRHDLTGANAHQDPNTQRRQRFLGRYANEPDGYYRQVYDDEFIRREGKLPPFSDWLPRHKADLHSFGDSW